MLRTRGKISRAADILAAFSDDVLLTYVGVGGGERFREILDSGVAVSQAYLIESHPHDYEVLAQNLRHLSSQCAINLYPLIFEAGDPAGEQAGQKPGGPTRPKAALRDTISSPSASSSVRRARFDDWFENLGEARISLLRVGAGSGTRDFLAGAVRTLSAHRVDALLWEETTGHGSEGIPVPGGDLDRILLGFGYRRVETAELIPESAADCPAAFRNAALYLSPKAVRNAEPVQRLTGTNGSAVQSPRTIKRNPGAGPVPERGVAGRAEPWWDSGSVAPPAGPGVEEALREWKERAARAERDAARLRRERESLRLRVREANHRLFALERKGNLAPRKSPNGQAAIGGLIRELGESVREIRRLRRGLAYGMGKHLIRSARTPWGLLTAPLAIVRSHWEARRIQSAEASGALEPCPRGTDRLGGRKPLTLELTPEPSRIFLPARDYPYEVRIKLLAVGGWEPLPLRLNAAVHRPLGGNSKWPRFRSAAFERNPSSEAEPIALNPGKTARILEVGPGEGGLLVSLTADCDSPCAAKVSIRKRGYEMRTAFELKRRQGLSAAAEYVEAHATPLQKRALHLLRADEEIDDESRWLTHLNRYIEQFGIAPLELEPGDAPRLHRLKARPDRVVREGPLISVILTAYNAENTVEFAARSILAQSWRNLELILVDDASTDATEEKIRQLARLDPRIRTLFNTENVGPYVSRNFALGIARGEYVTTHDADDWAHPERLERQIGAMLNAETPVRASIVRWIRFQPSGRLDRAYSITDFCDDGFFTEAANSLMIEADFLRRQLGFWDSVRFGGDNELIFRAKRILGDEFAAYRILGLIGMVLRTSLTRHPVYGISEESGLSPTRVQYRKCYRQWHRGLHRETSFLPFPHAPRRFPAPEEMVVPELNGRPPDSGPVAQAADAPASVPTPAAIKTDVCIVGDLRWKGGNARSIQAEIEACLSVGLGVRIVHCRGREDSAASAPSRRFQAFRDYVDLQVDLLDSEAILECDLLIVRHPGVIVSNDFEALASRIHAQTAAFVINNSLLRVDGSAVCTLSELNAAIARLPFQEKQVFPVGPLIREELGRRAWPGDRALSRTDWPMVFCEDDFPLRPQLPENDRIVIGMHGRDSADKWMNDPARLLLAYPDREDVTVRILGGAETPAAILGYRPLHWEVLPFDAVAVSEFLAQLDAFVFFPNANRNEAFGRTVIEAILTGVPCILSERLRPTFGDMAFYCAPDEVVPAARRLLESPERCEAFVRRARRRAIALYGRSQFLTLLAGTSETLRDFAEADPDGLLDVSEVWDGSKDQDLEAFARWVESGWNSVSPTDPFDAPRPS